MSRQPRDDQELARLPLAQRVARIRACFLQDRLNGLRHPPEDYVRDLPEAERPLVLIELRAADDSVSDDATTGYAPAEQDAAIVRERSFSRPGSHPTTWWSSRSATTWQRSTSENWRGDASWVTRRLVGSSCSGSPGSRKRR